MDEGKIITCFNELKGKSKTIYYENDLDTLYNGLYEESYTNCI
jgi:hypothetical protein